MTVFRIFLKIPWHLLLLSGVLVLVGAMALYSASQGSWQPWAGRHVTRATLGIVLVVVIAFVDFKLIKRSSYGLLILSILMLTWLLITDDGNGVSRWLNFGGVNIQPSEPCKVAVILALARYFDSQPAERLQSMLTYIPPIFMIAIPFLLVLKQPDLGTALMLLLGGLVIVFAAGLPWKYVFVAIVSAFSAMPILWSQLHDYQRARVMTFFNPESDILGAGYQITQSKIALGSGGFFGKGFLMGSQSQLNYLPEKQTDFVFTMIGEEFGFAGNIFILVVYLITSLSVLQISFRVKSRFAQLVCVGVAMMLFLYMFVNVAMVTGLLPVVGAPLPMISYGGTAMLTVFVAFGVVASASIHDRLN